MEELCRINRWETLKKKLKNLKPAEFLAMKKKQPNAILIDCRVPKEFGTGYLEGAKNMDYFGDKFYEQLEALDNEATYLVYCRSGRRSLRTCTLMQNSGFTKVYNLDGGLKSWFEELETEGMTN
ncbi:MAG: rhodanese-related sulfurtransferase [Paraglaciecola sp.]|jgi:rhodanese-related sulfurtransferase